MIVIVFYIYTDYNFPDIITFQIFPKIFGLPSQIHGFSPLENYPLVMTFTVRHGFSMAHRMVYLLKMVIFHGYVSHNQVVPCIVS